MNLSAISLHFLQITFITILALDNALLSEVPRGRDDRKSSFNFLKLVGGKVLRLKLISVSPVVLVDYTSRKWYGGDIQ
jgi:hypothetical protein